MSESEKIHALYEEFATEFLQPLLTGGTANATRFLPPGVLTHFALARPGDPEIDESIAEAMLAHASELVHVERLPDDDRGAMATAMALHNLVALTDPTLDRTFSRGAFPKVYEWVEALIESIEVPRTRGEALSRHVVLSRGLELQREDTVVKNWAYTYRFYGRPPPANVVAMPKLRFVREEKTRQPLDARGGTFGRSAEAALAQLTAGDSPTLDAEASEAATSSAMRELLARSPITELLRPELTPDLQFGQASLAVLSDSKLRHGIVQAIVERGTARVAQPFGHALRLLSALAPPPQYLATALTFLVEMQILEVMDERAGHQPRDEPAVGDEELFAAVLPAVLRTDGPMRHLAALEEPDMERIRERAEERAEQAGEDAVEFALSVLERSSPIAPHVVASPT